jgi:hypothetical protein
LQRQKRRRPRSGPQPSASPIAQPHERILADLWPGCIESLTIGAHEPHEGSRLQRQNRIRTTDTAALVATFPGRDPAFGRALLTALSVRTSLAARLLAEDSRKTSRSACHANGARQGFSPAAHGDGLSIHQRRPPRQGRWAVDLNRQAGWATARSLRVRGRPPARPAPA